MNVLALVTMNPHLNLNPTQLLENCREFLNDLRKANDANSLGNFFLNTMKQDWFGDDANLDDSYQSLVDQTFDKHKRFLQHVGLEVYYADGISADSPVRINDPGKFVQFFSKLSDTSFTPKDKENLQPLISSLVFQFDELCSAESLSDENKEILESFHKIGHICEMLGYKEGTEIFSAGLTLHNQDLYIPSKIVAHLNAALDQKNTFNPSKWHTDSTDSVYQDKWDKLLTNLLKISDEPVFSETFSDLWKEILKQANQARAEINNTSSLDHREEKLSVLETVFKRLKDLKPEN